MALGVSTVGVVLVGWVVFLGLLLAWLWLRGGRTPHVEGWSNSEFSERRRGDERRHQNLGPPPGVGERRTGFERRRRGLTVAGG
jgi:hypothetical protein